MKTLEQISGEINDMENMHQGISNAVASIENKHPFTLYPLLSYTKKLVKTIGQNPGSAITDSFSEEQYGFMENGRIRLCADLVTDASGKIYLLILNQGGSYVREVLDYLRKKDRKLKTGEREDIPSIAELDLRLGFNRNYSLN